MSHRSLIRYYFRICLSTAYWFQMQSIILGCFVYSITKILFDRSVCSTATFLKTVKFKIFPKKNYGEDTERALLYGIPGKKITE